jgi:(p)ppGpp synthase/HD superfamily hydrolase
MTCELDRIMKLSCARSVQATISRHISGASQGVPSETTLWQSAKKDSELKALYNPVVHRAHVIASVIHHACKEGRRCSLPLEHLEQTAIIVAKLGLSAEAIAAALLQDAFESPGMTDAVLSRFMPEEVVQLVAGLSQARTLSGLYRAHPGLREEVRWHAGACRARLY